MTFDKDAYLAANPDVAASVASGAFGGDPYQHYLQYGQAEGRSPSGLVPTASSAAQPNWASGAGYASNIKAPAGTGEYYGQMNDAWAAYRAGSGVNPITGKTADQEKDTWWSTNNYMMQPDIAMNYIVNGGAAGVDPAQYALSHADMSIAGGDLGRGGILPTGQTNFERQLGAAGGTFYNTFGQGDKYSADPALLDPLKGVTISDAGSGRYQQVFGQAYSNTGPFAGAIDQNARAAYLTQTTNAFNGLTANGLVPTSMLTRPFLEKSTYSPSGSVAQPASSYTPSSSTSTAGPTDVELVDSRIGGLLATDSNGNYVNQVVRQATDRAMQSFAQRGLLNTSMAQQAAQEAAISKATEIATTDAGALNAAREKSLDRSQQSSEAAAAFDRTLQQLAISQGYDLEKLREQYGLDQTAKNTTATQNQEWNLQSAYKTARQQADLNYSNETNAINQSNMTVEQKQAAIASAADKRDAALATLNEVYAASPEWKSQWSTVAVLTSESGVKSITSVSRLNAILNDPAQAENVKAAARTRLAELSTPA